MWFDTYNGEWIEEIDHELPDILLDIANSDRKYFNTDDYINSFYPSITYFGVDFYPAEIIKNIDEMLYDDITDELIEDWVASKVSELEKCEPEEGITLADILDEPNFELLRDIVWKERD